MSLALIDDNQRSTADENTRADYKCSGNDDRIASMHAIAQSSVRTICKPYESKKYLCHAQLA